MQTLCLQDVTKFGSVDLIVGDSKGTLTFFGNKQILYKMAISEGCISAVTTDIDAGRYNFISSILLLFGYLPCNIQE